MDITWGSCPAQLLRLLRGACCYSIAVLLLMNPLSAQDQAKTAVPGVGDAKKADTANPDTSKKVDTADPNPDASKKGGVQSDATKSKQENGAGDVSSGTVIEPSAVKAYWVAFAVCTALLVVLLLIMMASLKKNPDWSLAGALSEESSPIVAPTTSGTTAPPSGVSAPRLVGSSSRMISAFGLLVLAVVLLGIGYSIMWSLFSTQKLPDLSGLGPYLLGGSALFAPYAFNQLKEAFK